MTGRAGALSSDTAYVTADSLKNNYITIDGLWRFHPGDDSSWAAADLDHSEWDTLRTRIDDEDIYRQKWKGIGWFRKIVQIDSALLGKSIALMVNQYGASEIYFNSMLIKSYGEIDSASEKHIQPNSMPFVIRLDSSYTQVIAVRFSNYAGLENPRFLLRHLENLGFRLRMGGANYAIGRKVGNVTGNTFLNSLLSGLFISLFILYLLLYLFYARKKENLFYAVFTLCLGFVLITNPIRLMMSEGLLVFAVINLLSIIAFVLLFLAYLGFLYSIFYSYVPRWSLFFPAFAIIVLASVHLAPTDQIVNILLGVYISITSLEGLRIIIVALRKKTSGAWTIGSGVLVFVLFAFTSILINTIDLTIPPYIILSIIMGGILSFPITMSIYLARDVAKTNADLEEQLVTVKELSAKEVEHQKNNAELAIQTEKEKAAGKEATLRAQAAELQAKASEAQARIIQAENERKTKELEEARELQLSMLPKDVPQLDHLSIATHMRTATEVGGDYYDFHVNGNGVLTVVIGDATGHGLKAGTLVTATKSLFTTHAANEDILSTLKEYNRSLKQLNFRFLFMCLLKLKIDGYKMRLSSAGMPPMLIYRSANSSVEEVLLKGLPLGSTADVTYELRELGLNPGDTILLMSDGFPELLNKEGEMFGYDKISAVFAEVGNRDKESIIEHLKDVASDWVDGEEPNDDVTFVVIKVKNS